MNAEWHRTHRLASSAAMDERIEWHLAHVEACGCRPIPASVTKAIEDRTKPSAKG